MLTPTLLRAAEAHLQSVDPRLAALIQRVGPCQLAPQPAQAFQVLLRSIISQQLSNKAADTIESRLHRLAAPEPAALAALGDEAMRGAGLSAAKVRYIRALSQATAEGRLDFDALARQQDEAVIEALVPYPGIGRWTAEMFLIFALGRPDVLAVDDLGLRRGAQRLHDLPERPKAKQFRELAEPWQPWRSVASWYLWRVVDA